MAKVDSVFMRWARQPMQSGEGLHGDIWKASVILLEHGYPVESVFRLIREAADRVQDRVVPDREIISAIEYAQRKVAGLPSTPAPTWPEFNEAVRAEICKTPAPSILAFADAVDQLPQDSAFYLNQIFRPHELVCLGATAFSFKTLGVREAGEVAASYKIEYINPNPMTSIAGLTKDGRESEHCAENTGPKVYQVIEFDRGTLDEHASLLWALARHMPLFMVVYSGGKSLHGWFDLTDRMHDEVERFFASAVMIGADRRMWPACQFARLPGGWNNKTGRQQMVVYFEPKNLRRTSAPQP